METIIKRVADSYGIFRIVRNIDASYYSSDEWLHNPITSAVDAIDEIYWKVDGEAVVEMSQLEKDIVDSFIADHDNVMVAGTLAFEEKNNCSNKWLGLGTSKSSDQTPYISPCPMTVTAITFINDEDSISTDIEIYKNGVKLYTWELQDKRWAWKTQGLHSIEFLQGDRIGIFLKDTGTNPKNVIVTLHYSAWSHVIGEGGSSTI